MTMSAVTDSTTPMMDGRFTAVAGCWICGAALGERVVHAPFDLAIYREQDPELADYTGTSVWLRRCNGCGFVQPEALPTLPGYFDRMYDTRWSDDWIADEFHATYRDRIFTTVLRELDGRMTARPRRLLDVGAHVGRFVHLAAQAGWDAEGIELNPRTSAFAARATGRPVHAMNAHDLAASGERYDAVTLLDVLEHIPEPVRMLRSLHGLLRPGGWAAVKVPCGRSQLTKERIRSTLRPGYRINVANNLVHVNHFTPRSLRLALERAGFAEVRLTVGAPEEPPLRSGMDVTGRASRLWRGFVYRAARMPGGVHTPLAMNLQAYARRGD